MPYIFVFLAVVNFVVFGYFKFVQTESLSQDAEVAKQTLPLIVETENPKKPS